MPIRGISGTSESLRLTAKPGAYVPIKKRRFVMSRSLVLFILVVSLAASGCVDGGEIAADALEEIDRYFENQFADMYREFAQDTSVADDGVLTENEVDCSDPLFTRTEPLPGGITGITPVNPSGTYWRCDDGTQEIYFPNGTLQGFIVDEYLTQDVRAFWNQCQVGTQPPDYRGEWRVTTDGYFCVRFDIIPGIALCTTGTVSSSTLIYGGTGVYILQYGEAIDYYTGEDVICSLY